jgi:hypothetical protein
MSEYQDDVFTTLSLPGDDVVLTYSLFIKTDVHWMLVIAMLHKSDDAFMWAHELFDSGFVMEVLQIMWNIYFDLFAICTPNYSIMLMHLTREYKNVHTPHSERKRMLHSIINSMLQFPINIDVFMARTAVDLLEFSEDLPKVAEWDLKSNAIFVAHHILTAPESTLINIRRNVEYHAGTPLPKITHYPSHDNIATLATVFKLLYDNPSDTQYSKRRTLHIIATDENIAPHTPYIKQRQNLSQSFDRFNCLALFEVNRCGGETMRAISTISSNWLYHAAFSPVWKSRIKEHSGYCNYIKKLVLFTDDALENKFVDEHFKHRDLEEMCAADQLKFFGDISDTEITWASLFNSHVMQNSANIEIPGEYLAALDA